MSATAVVRIVCFIHTKRPTNRPTLDPQADEELIAASRSRREADWMLPMSERLARLHELCKQMSAVKGSARRH
jgi:hypothetical protein